MEAIVPVASVGVLAGGVVYLRRPFDGRRRLAYAAAGAVLVAAVALPASLIRALA